MKIAINLTRDYVGGITTSNLSLMHHLHKHDYEFVGVELTGKMYMKGPTLFRPFAPELFDHHIINFHHLPIQSAVNSKTTLVSLERHYRESIDITRNILRETKPDVVFLSGTYYIPWLISVAARLEKIPIVLWYSGILSKETEHYPEAKRKLFAKMEYDIASSASATIFPSKICKTVVEEQVLKKKVKRSFIIPNPLPAIFTETTPVDISIERRISAVGRYAKIKNFDQFFKVHKLLNKQKWNHSASFVTNADISSKTVPKTIEILPPMTPEGLKSFYLSQGLIVCPSVFETFGNVPMEAASLGIPVLVSDTMGCSEILYKAGLKNMVISFNDSNIVVERVKELCGQSILPRQMNAIRRMLDPHLINEEIRAVITAAVAYKKGKK
jgi:glycosyltransferase involved in cell wall biosynthesis